MEVKLDLGGTVDIVTSGELTAVAGDLKRAMRDEIRGGLMKPIRRKQTAQSDVATASGIVKAVLNSNSIPPGRYWSLRNLVILGDDDHTAVVNATAALYIGDPVSSGYSEVNDTFTTVPASDQYSEGELVAGPGDVFFVVAYGITAGHTIIVNARFDDYPSAALVPGAV